MARTAGFHPRRRSAFVLGALLALLGCSPTLEGFPGMMRGSPCVLAPQGMHRLAPELDESSGVVASPTHAGVFWTHNDSGGAAALFAVDARGTLLGRVEVEGARNRDWEDLGIGPCGADPGHCLYIADVGDNQERRDYGILYRISEPDPSDARSDPVHRFDFVLPHGPRDIEAIYILPGERVFLVTKGRNHPVEVYRLPAPLGDAPLGAAWEHPLEAERIQTLSGTVPAFGRRVTGGAQTPDGRVVALRTYETLHFYMPDGEGRLAPIPGGLVNLRSLREPQGEAVGFVPGGGIVLTSESGPGPLGRIGTIAHLRCTGLPVEW